MFGFFEKAISDLSEIVAPIGASNQLFLAIQHGRNDECIMLINSACKDFDVRTNADCGYGALHIACKYNNREMVDEITRRGVSIEFLDKSGNTPLHYACKGGNLDLVKYLIDAGASVLKQNNQNQRPYDVAESHVIRQFLLPLQFKAEAEAQHNPSRGAGPNYDPYMYVSGIETQGGPVNGDPEQRAAMAAAAAAAQPPPIMSAPPMSGAAANSANPYAAGASTLQHPSYAAYPGFSNPASAPAPAQVPPTGVASQPSQPSATSEVQAPPAAVPATTTSPRAHPPAVNVSNVATGSGAQPVSIEVRSDVASATIAAAREPEPSPAAAPPAAAPPAAASTASRPPAMTGPPSTVVHVSNSPLKSATPASVPAPVAGAITAPPSEPVAAAAAPAGPTTGPPSAPAQGSISASASASKPLTFMPDGFHSSSNDPVLQERYGHHKLVKNIAPPPIFGAPPVGGVPGAGAPPPGPAGSSYGLPPPPPAVSLTTTGPPHSMGTGTGTGIAAPSAPGTQFSAPVLAPIGQPPSVVGAPPMMAPPRTAVHTATAAAGPARPQTHTFSPSDDAVSLSSSSSSVM